MEISLGCQNLITFPSRNAAPGLIATLDVLWYVPKIAMNRSRRIFAAMLVLTALVPTAFVHSNIICVEASGRISYGCNDVVPDEMLVRLAAVPLQLGLSSQDCGFCHDYTVGQAVTQSLQHSALPVPITRLHQEVFSQRAFTFLNESRPIALLDSSGSISPLKC